MALTPAELLAQQRTLEVLYETRVASLERLVGFFVVFHTMAKAVEQFWSLVSFRLLAYDCSRTQSRLRVASTASPVSVVRWDIGDDSMTFDDKRDIRRVESRLKPYRGGRRA